jgi:hypothetical protein
MLMPPSALGDKTGRNEVRSLTALLKMLSLLRVIEKMDLAIFPAISSTDETPNRSQ